uniref:Uncharacterized protein n=1 Tax=Ditylenchus dipsaci TaxID=166011 RepID=A0A915EDG7_9BILA
MHFVIIQLLLRKTQHPDARANEPSMSTISAMLNQLFAKRSAIFPAVIAKLARALQLLRNNNYDQIWTAKFTVLCSLLCWLIGSATTIFTVFLVDTDPALFTGHSINTFYLEDYILSKHNLKGAAIENFMSTHIFTNVGEVWQKLLNN